MTDEITPLEKLDDAVREYLDAIGDEGQLSGWVLATSTTIITAEEGVLPLAFASDFTMGPSTSPEAAVGLARFTAARITDQVLYGADEEDDS